MGHNIILIEGAYVIRHKTALDMVVPGMTTKDKAHQVL